VKHQWWKSIDCDQRIAALKSEIDEAINRGVFKSNSQYALEA
jgi:uncharacterized small protein (DUF1192 family)